MINLAETIRQWVFHPGDQVSRWQRFVRYWAELSWFCAGELQHDKAHEMAAALTYRTVFSLIPVLVLALVVFNAFAGFQELRATAQDQVLQFLGLHSLGYNQVETGIPAPVPEDVPAEAPNVAQTVKDKKVNRDFVVDLINNVIARVDTVDFKSIGAVGFVLLIWTALGLAVAMETAFNQILGAVAGRSWGRRIIVYWTALTLGPVLIVVSIVLATQARNYIDNLGIGILGTLLSLFSRFTALGITWVLLLFLYRFMPNTRVQFRAAVVGSFVAAVLWELAKYGYAMYCRTVLPYSLIYGSLGLIPLTLFWIYLTWLIILFGLELTHTLQAMKGRTFKHLAQQMQAEGEVVDTAMVVPLVGRIASAFRQGRACDVAELGRELNLPPRLVTRLLIALEEQGLINRVLQGREREAFSLARPPESVPLRQILTVAQSLLPPPPPAANGDRLWTLVEILRASEPPEWKGKTLADL